MFNFLKALVLFVKIYKDGFFMSENSHTEKDGSRWGFYRFNYVTESALFDIDYQFNSPNRKNYFHVHGDDFRLEFNQDSEKEKMQ